MKTLLIDIETAPALAYIWNLKTRYVPKDHVAMPGYTLCFAAMWHGQKKVEFHTAHGERPKDKGENSPAWKTMTQRAWELLDEADVVVHYNGDRFDVPCLQADFWAHSPALPPPSPYRSVDLFKTVRKTTRQLSYSLDSVAQKYLGSQKVKHEGMSLWTACMIGDEAAWKRMRRYNIQDVRLLGQLYDRIKAWIKPLPNPHLYDGGGSDPACTVCGGRVKENGHAYLSTGVYKRYKCVEDGCGAHSRSRTTSMSPEDRSGVLVRA